MKMGIYENGNLKMKKLKSGKIKILKRANLEKCIF